MGTGGLDHLVKLGSGNRSGKASVIAWANGISEYVLLFFGREARWKALPCSFSSNNFGLRMTYSDSQNVTKYLRSLRWCFIFVCVASSKLSGCLVQVWRIGGVTRNSW